MEPHEVQLEPPFKFSWRCGPSMPSETAWRAHAVVVGGKLYVGGGTLCFLGEDNKYIVTKYNISTKQWTKLPQYIARYFTLVGKDNQLLLVGGKVNQNVTNKLGVWDTNGRMEWTYPYPEMPTARCKCSAVVHKSEWLVVVGGEAGGDLSTVELLNFSTKQWCDGPRAPVPMTEMLTAVVRETCYFMGGYSEGETIDHNRLYTMTLPTLIEYITSKDPRSKRARKRHIWKTIPGIPFIFSSPLCIGEYLLAVGGEFEKKNGYADAVKDILLYQPDRLEWVKVGDLPSPRLKCTCVMLSEKELFTAGGEDINCQYQPGTYFSLINQEHSVEEPNQEDSVQSNWNAAGGESSGQSAEIASLRKSTSKLRRCTSKLRRRVEDLENTVSWLLMDS